MAYNPWMTSNDIIEAVKRKIAFPVSQNTFSEEDILRFANEEMFISQVPSVLQYHEEYFVYRVQTPLVSNISRYSIPDRAIGMRLRDLMWTDSAGNFFEMTRISADDKAFFQRNIGANQAIHKFYIENNDVVLTPSVIGDPTGFLNFFIFMRPNQLVKNERARTIQSFTQDITVVDNSALVVGDKITITIATQSPNPIPTDITIVVGVNAAATAANIQAAITSAAIEGVTASVGGPINLLNNAAVTFQDAGDTVTYAAHGLANGTPISFSSITSTTGISPNVVYYVTNATINTFQLASSTGGPTLALTTNGSGVVANNVVTCAFDDITTSFIALNETALSISSQLGFTFGTELGSLFSVGSKIDFLQTKPGHKTYVFDIRVKAVANPSVGVYVLKVNRSDLLIPLSTGYNFPPLIAGIQTGDYVCLAGESIIPQLPPDLHNMLAEKTAARILASLGDQAGHAMANDKIKEMEYRQGTLLNDRVDGAPQKITSRHSILRYNKMGVRKRM